MSDSLAGSYGERPVGASLEAAHPLHGVSATERDAPRQGDSSRDDSGGKRGTHKRHATLPAEEDSLELSDEALNQLNEQKQADVQTPPPLEGNAPMSKPLFEETI